MRPVAGSSSHQEIMPPGKDTKVRLDPSRDTAIIAAAFELSSGMMPWTGDIVGASGVGLANQVSEARASVIQIVMAHQINPGRLPFDGVGADGAEEKLVEVRMAV